MLPASPIPHATPERLRRLFLEGFTVLDIAEPLVSFDADASASVVRERLNERDFDLVGVRREGLVCGYAVREELGTGLLGDHLRAFDQDDCVDEGASLVEAIQSLGVNGRCFVTVLDRAGAIVALADLEKPPVRMLLFGMITIVEMLVAGRIRDRFPEGGWEDRVAEARLAKARVLQQERARRGECVDLLECLQFSDKGQILLRDPAERAALGLASRKEGLRTLKELETLRNNLAHSQGIVASSWARIVRFTGNLDRLLAAQTGRGEPRVREGA